MSKHYSFLLDLAKIVWGNGLAKTSSAIALIGAISATSSAQHFVVGIIDIYFNKKINIPDQSIYVSLFLVVIGLSFSTINYYITSNVARNAVSAHDIDLFEKFQTIFPDYVIRFFRDHDFRISFLRSNTDPIGELYNWKGPRYCFQDVEIQDKFRQMYEISNNLADLIAEYTSPTNHDLEKNSVIVSRFDDSDMSDPRHSEIKQLNEMSSAFFTSINEFEAVAIRKLRN